MDTETLDQEINMDDLAAIYNDAEPEIKALIKDGSWKNAVHKIVSDHNLDQEDGVGLGSEILQVFLNISSWQDFLDGLTARLIKERDEIKQIAEEIKVKIFNPAGIVFETPELRDKIKNMKDEDLDKITRLLNISQEEVVAYLSRLPDEIIQAITSLEVAETISQIAKKYYLHIDQAGQLANETTLVLIGRTRPYEYLDKIKRALGVPEDIAKNITKDINETVFQKVKNSLQQVHSLEHQIGEPEKTAATETPAASQVTNTGQSAPADNGAGPAAAKEPLPAGAGRNVFAERAGGLTRQPTEVVDINLDEPELATGPDGELTETAKKSPRHDPYREPPE